MTGKIVTDNKVLQPVNTFTFMGCKISQKEAKDMSD
jgi:hypothetical protein